MIYEYVMYAGYASIILSLAMTIASAFDLSVTLKRSKPVVTVKQIGQHVFVSDLVTLSNTRD